MCVYVEPLAELHRPGLVAKLNKTMYGTQDASNAWQKLCCEHLRRNGFELGGSNPALYRFDLVNVFCHGDDFVTAAAEDQIEIFGKMLQDKFDTRRIGMIGAAKHLDTASNVVSELNHALCVFWRKIVADISETIKCLARVMLTPRAGHMKQLKRVARYLKGVPMRAQQYPHRSQTDHTWKYTWTVTGLETR